MDAVQADDRHAPRFDELQRDGRVVHYCDKPVVVQRGSGTSGWRLEANTLTAQLCGVTFVHG
jgi:hypothetical protein